MIVRSILLCVFPLVLLAVLAVPDSSAQWQLGGGVVCNSGENQQSPSAIPDGAGGFIVAWHDTRSGNYDIYAQRLDSRGAPLWPEGGVPVCTAILDQHFPSIIGDGRGGAIVTWEDSRNSGSTLTDVYAQRIDSLGAALWSANGVSICTAAGSQTAPRLVEDRASGALLLWTDNRTGMANIFIQRVDLDGVRLWTPNGIGIATNSFHARQTPWLIADGSGGAFVVWEEFQGSSPTDIFAQHIAADGLRLWGNNGAIVSAAANSQMRPRATVDEAGGLIVAWDDYRSGSGADSYAQKLTAGGLPAWSDNGVALSMRSGSQYVDCLAPDGSGGAIVAWTDYPGLVSSNICAQRINSLGVLQWTSEGLVLCNASGNQYGARCVGDGMLGVVIAWVDGRFGASDLFAQRLLTNGATQWIGNGVELSKNQDASVFVMAPDSVGGAGVFWHRPGYPDSDVYGQRVLLSGDPGYRLNLSARLASIQDVLSDQGGWLRIALVAATGDPEQLEPLVTGYNLWRRIEENSSVIAQGTSIDDTRSPLLGIVSEIGSRARVLHTTESASAGFPPGAWESLGFHSATQSASYTLLAPTKQDSTMASNAHEVFVVTVHTTDPTIYSVSPPDSGYSVDNLAPAQPQSVLGEVTGPERIRISWGANRERDFLHYVVHKGATARFVPSPTTLLDTPTAPSLTDSAFEASSSYYKIGAVDNHGNVSTFAELEPSHIAGVQDERRLTRTSISGATPNPFTRDVVFGLEMARPGKLRVSVHDVSGRLVRRLLEASLDAGGRSVVWDGLDDHGTAVGPGAYFVLFSTPEIAQVRRVQRVP